LNLAKIPRSIHQHIPRSIYFSVTRLRSDMVLVHARIIDQSIDRAMHVYHKHEVHWNCETEASLVRVAKRSDACMHACICMEQVQRMPVIDRTSNCRRRPFATASSHAVQAYHNYMRKWYVCEQWSTHRCLQTITIFATQLDGVDMQLD
jgi:hypothetical protein